MRKKPIFTFEFFEKEIHRNGNVNDAIQHKGVSTRALLRRTALYEGHSYIHALSDVNLLTHALELPSKEYSFEIHVK